MAITGCTDLIIRSALLAEYDRVHVGEPGGERKLIAEAPAVDAEPVRQGRWMLESAGWKRVTFDGYMHCPNCNEAFRRIVGTKLFKRCPECGCIMDGGKQDDNDI